MRGEKVVLNGFEAVGYCGWKYATECVGNSR